MEAIWSSGNGSQAQGRGVDRVAVPANREHQPQNAQPVEGETKDAQLKMSKSQSMPLEAREEAQQPHGADDLHVPPDGTVDQHDTIDP